MRRTYTFDEVALVPQYNNIPSRAEPALGTWLTRTQKAAIPLIAANMDTVIGESLADVVIDNGTVPVLHRFTSFVEQQAWVKRCPEQTYVSAGMHQGNEIRDLLENGALDVCIDVAHGHSDQMLRFLESLKQDYPDKQCIAGNVCTAMAYHDLVNAGADAVKVGIGPGAACTTRLVTGFGVPQFSAVRECAEVTSKLHEPLDCGRWHSQQPGHSAGACCWREYRHDRQIVRTSPGKCGR
jgi:IMP dehydrogenase